MSCLLLLCLGQFSNGGHILVICGGIFFGGGGGNISCYTGKILALGSKSFTADDLIIQFDFSFFE
jgi:hypothetical protein